MLQFSWPLLDPEHRLPPLAGAGLEHVLDLVLLHLLLAPLLLEQLLHLLHSDHPPSTLGLLVVAVDVDPPDTFSQLILNPENESE